MNIGEMLAAADVENVELGERLLAVKARNKEQYEDLIAYEEMLYVIKCLERVRLFTKLTITICLSGHPIAAALVSRGIVETTGILNFFIGESDKAKLRGPSERMETLKKFSLSSKRFGLKSKPVHVMDSVRSLQPISQDIMDLYDLLCEAVHPNWLGVARSTEVLGGGGSQKKADDPMYLVNLEAIRVGQNLFRATIEKIGKTN